MSHIVFFVPGKLATVSGGYGYDRAVIAGLRAAGHAVDVVELEGRHPLPDDTATTAATAAWRAMAADALPVIDGMGLAAFAPLADALQTRGAVALIHHPTALEPDHDAATRDALRAAERALTPRFRRVIVTSPATGERLAAEFGVASERIAIVVPGTADAPRSTGSGDGGGCAILSIGVITPRKGHDTLLRALALLPDLAWTLTIVGPPRDRAHATALVALAGELGIAPRVRFAGEQVGAALDALWRHADLFALATRFEGYGMVIAEALKRGLPVAVTEGGAAGALVTPETGIVAAVDDHAALSRAMRRLIFDHALRRDMSEAAWQAGQALPDWTRQSAAFIGALHA